MKNKYLHATVISLVAFVVIGTGVVVAKFMSDDEIFTDFFDNGYYHKLLSKGPNDKAAQAEIDRLRTQALEWQAAIEANKHLTPEQIAAGEKKLNDFTNELARQQLLHPSPPSPELLFEGIVDGATLDPGPDFITIASWGGKLNNEVLYVFVGYDPSNPSQGVIKVSNNSTHLGQVYSTPTATGPVKITAENNKVLTLQSIAGEYEQWIDHGGEPSVKVTVKGGATYYFDLKTRLFK